MKKYKLAFDIIEKDSLAELIKSCLYTIFAGIFTAINLIFIFSFVNLITNNTNYNNYLLSFIKYIFPNLGHKDHFNLVAALTLMMIFISTFTQIASTTHTIRSTTSLITKLSNRIFRAYLLNGYQNIIENNTRSISDIIINEVDNAVFNFYRPIGEIIGSFVTIVSIAFTLIYLSPVAMVTLLIVLAVIYFTLFHVNSHKIQKLGKNRNLENKKRIQILNSTSIGIKTIKSYKIEEEIQDNFRISTESVSNSFINFGVMNSIPRYFIQLLLFSGIVIFGVFIYEENSGKTVSNILSYASTIAVLVIAAQRLMPELQKMYSATSQIKYSADTIQNLANFIKINQYVSQNKIPDIKEEFQKKEFIITIKDLKFNFKDSTHAVLNEINFNLISGKKYAIVGKSGAGKTTIADILSGLLAQTSGTFQLNGTHLPSIYNNLEWSDNLAYVTQNTFLLDGTIRENIILNNEYDQNRFDEAIEFSYLKEILDKLPLGVNTLIGAGGAILSGGQVQRLSIARAIYKKPKILILDEATSALDGITESYIVDFFNKFNSNCILLIIAHRLNTIKFCDQIIVIDNGMIADIGNWDELVTKSLKFNNLLSGINENES